MNKCQLSFKGFLLLIFFAFAFTGCRHDADISDLPQVYYDTDVKPIISAQCVMCHAELDSYNGLMDNVVKGKPFDSELYKVITNPWALIRMPQSPRPPLTIQQRSIIHLWILQGAAESAQ